MGWKDTSKGKISNLVWQKGKQKDRKNDPSEIKGQFKDISNNVLFPSYDEDEEKIGLSLEVMGKILQRLSIQNVEIFTVAGR